MVFFFYLERGLSFLFAQVSICFCMKTSLNFFSQYWQVTITTLTSSISSPGSPGSSCSPYSFSFFSSSFSYFLMALMAALKSSEAAFQLSPVLFLSKPLPFVAPIFFFSYIFCCLFMAA